MTVPLKPIAEQVVLVTGASSGIGLLTAHRAAALGARVMLVARGEPALRIAVEGIREAGGEAEYAVADVGNRAAVEAAADAAIARFGRIDTWVNNAGVAIYAKLVDTPAEEHERLFRTNYFGVVNGSLAAVRRLREHGGAIVTVGSIGADTSIPVLSAYGASKHAVRAYVESLRMELEADGVPIAVTLVKPSGVATPIAEHAAVHIEGTPRVPPPVYDPDVVAQAILDAAQRHRRDVTVGGQGRAAVLAGNAFPRLKELLTPVTERVFRSPAPSPDGPGNLFSPGEGGRERARGQSGRTVSLYTRAVQNPAFAGIAALGAVLALAAAAGRRRRL